MSFLNRILSKANTQRPLMGSNFGGGVMAGGGQPIGPYTQLRQMQSLTGTGWLFAVVDRIAQGVAAQQWTLYQLLANDDRRAVPNHPSVALWDAPNPFFTHEEFIEVSIQHFLLTGEMWWMLLHNQGGGLAEIWPIRPDRMAPVKHAENYISGYTYSIGGQKIPLEVDDVIFIRRQSPVDPYRGVGVVQSLLTDIGSEAMAAKWTNEFFKNSAEPGGVIEFDQSLSDSDFNKLVHRWNDQHKGVSNAHRVAIIERGKWQDRKITQRDMQFEQLRKLNREIILGAFGMPGHMLGLTETVNRANAEAGEVMFARWIIVPLLTRLSGGLKRLKQKYPNPENYQWAYKDPTPKNRQQDLLEAQVGYNSGFLTQNEARERIGEGEVDGGDIFRGPAASFPVSAGVDQLALKNGRRNGHQKFDDPGDIIPDAVLSIEMSIVSSWERRLSDEADAIAEYIEDPTKSVSIDNQVQKLELSDVDLYNWDWWSKYANETIDELTNIMFVALQDAIPTIDMPVAQQLAVNYAETRAARLIKLDGDLTLVAKTQERVRSLVANTIETGGSLGELKTQLKADYIFSSKRAQLIARTETATAMGQGKKQAALDGDQNEKRSINQGSDTVCPICIANANAGWIKITEPFPRGQDTIPFHPGCQCNVSYRQAVEEGPKGASDVHCPSCARLLGRSVSHAKLWCRSCKVNVTVINGVAHKEAVEC